MNVRIPKLRIGIWAIMLSMFFPLVNPYGWELFVHLWPFFVVFCLSSLANVRKKVNHWKPCMFIYAFLGYVIISFFLFGKYEGSLKITLYHVFEAVVFIFVGRYYFDEIEIRSIIKAYIFSGIAIVFKMIVQHTLYGHETFRYTIVNFGHQMDVNFLAAFLVFPALYSFYDIIQYKQRTTSSTIMFALFVGGIIFTGSRGALLAIAIGIAILYLDLHNITTKKILFVIVAIIVIITTYFAIPQIMDRFSIERLFDSSNEFRLRLWRAAWNIFLASPILGNGANCVYSLGIYYGGVHGMSQHNMFLEVMTDYGIIGLLCICGLLFSLIRCCVKSKNVLALSIIISTTICVSLIPGLDSATFWINLMITLVATRNDSISTTNNIAFT